MKKHITKTQQQLILLSLFCLSLLIVRVKLTGSFFFGFLVWNLFLAAIPFIISERLKHTYKQASKLKISLYFLCWLLFLPNAPYIITDFIHLHHEKSILIWFDMFLIFSFALTGLLFALISINDMHKIIQTRTSKKAGAIFLYTIPFLCGFGIYLGRFIRFNSWDVFTRPLAVLKTSLTSFTDIKTWFITLAFGGLLYILLMIAKSFSTNSATKQF